MYFTLKEDFVELSAAALAVLGKILPSLKIGHLTMCHMSAVNLYVALSVAHPNTLVRLFHFLL